MESDSRSSVKNDGASWSRFLDIYIAHFDSALGIMRILTIPRLKVRMVEHRHLIGLVWA